MASLRPARFVLALMLAGIAGALGATTGDGWQYLGRSQNAAALGAFRAAPVSRDSRLGEAVALLNLQPKTEANLDRAAALLEDLGREGDSDDPGIAALYYRARLAQIHRARPNLEEATRLYRELVARHPMHPLGQLAAVKLAMLSVWRPNVDPKVALAEAEGLGTRLSDPVALRDFHLALANAYALGEVSEAKSLDHLLAAHRTGEVSGKVAADVLVRIGELCRLSGKKAQAAEFYSAFLRQFPRDARAFTVRLRLKEVQ